LKLPLKFIAFVMPFFRCSIHYIDLPINLMIELYFYLNASIFFELDFIFALFFN